MVRLILLATFVSVEVFAQNVYTPNNTLVPTASYFSYNLSQSQLNSAQNDVQNGVYGSSCVVISNSSNAYNCHGYAWNMFQMNGRTVALDDYYQGAVSTYINDNSYTSTSSTTLYGVRVRYSGDHSAVVTALTNRYLSKWGPGPVVRHAPGDVPPSYSSPYAYYRCNFQSYVTSAQLDGGSTSYGSSPSFVAYTGSHYITVETAFGGFVNSWVFSTPPSMPGLSIYSQSGNSVYFDKNAYNQQGKYISLTVTNGCSVSSTQSTIYVGDPSGVRMAAFPVPATGGEITVDFQRDARSPSGKQDKYTPDFRNSSATQLVLYDDQHNVVRDYSGEAGEKSLKIDARQLKPGTYYLRAVFSDQSTETKRLIVK